MGGHGLRPPFNEPMTAALVKMPIERIAQKIYVIRGERVIIDSDLAKIYGVTTARLNQQVRRNADRFPADFMFELTADEHAALMLQFATSKKGRGGRRKLPLVFTEHGALMAANVLNSKRAVEASVQVVRAFVRMRNMLASNAELAKKIEALESKYDSHFKVVFEAIKKLMMPPAMVAGLPQHWRYYDARIQGKYRLRQPTPQGLTNPPPATVALDSRLSTRSRGRNDRKNRRQKNRTLHPSQTLAKLLFISVE